MNAAGNFVVVWTDNASVMGQMFTAAGAKKGAAFQIDQSSITIAGNTTSFGNPADPSVAINATGNFVVSWSEVQSPGLVYPPWGPPVVVMARQFKAAGAPQGDEFVVGDNSFRNIQSQVAMDNAGDFVVTWQGLPVPVILPEGSFVGEYANFYNAKGALQQKVWLDDGMNPPSVAMDGKGDVVITWQNNHQIIAQKFTSTGRAVGESFTVNSNTNGSDPSVGIDSTGNFIVSWLQENSLGAVTGIASQRFVKH
jgi:hypothetical protein